MATKKRTYTRRSQSYGAGLGSKPQAETPKEETDPTIKNYRCTVCNLVRKVKGAESPLLEMNCIFPDCKNNRFQFWKGEVKVLKLQNDAKLLFAMKGIINV